MEFRQAQDMPELLRELGINYDPDRLAEMLKNRGGEVRARAIKVTASVGAFLARILAVSMLTLDARTYLYHYLQVQLHAVAFYMQLFSRSCLAVTVYRHHCPISLLCVTSPKYTLNIVYTIFKS